MLCEEFFEPFLNAWISFWERDMSSASVQPIRVMRNRMMLMMIIGIYPFLNKLGIVDSQSREWIFFVVMS